MSLIEPVEGMPKKRRKLNKEMEAEMAAAKRKIELVGALINDIRDEDIQGEYLGAFTQIRSAVVNLIAKYTTDGFCEETEGSTAFRFTCLRALPWLFERPNPRCHRCASRSRC